MKRCVEESPWLVNETRNEGMYAIHDMVRAWSPEMVKFFLDKGNSPDLRSEDGMTCLHHCAITASANINGSIEVAKLIISYRADVNVPDDHNNTAINMAAYEGATKLVELLLNNGADPTIANKWNSTPLSNAKKRKHQEIVDLLTKYLQDHNLPVK